MGRIKIHSNRQQPGKLPKGSGKKRKYRGKRVLPGGSPRAHTHGGHSQADAGWSAYNCPAGKGKPPGKYKVPAPLKRWQRRGIVRNATTGEQVQ
jgi:hypothetical protein